MRVGPAYRKNGRIGLHPALLESVGTALGEHLSGWKGYASAASATLPPRSVNGDMYAGHDGNVYKNTAVGWQKYDNGSWNNGKQIHPTTAQSNNAAASDQYGEHESELLVCPAEGKKAIPITLPTNKRRRVTVSSIHRAPVDTTTE